MAQVENLKIGNTSYEINDKKAVHIVDILPSPTADLVGKVYFAKGFAGSETENSFFLCESSIGRSFEITYTEAIDDIEITDPSAFYDILDAAFHEHEGQSMGDGEAGLIVFYDDNISPVWRLIKNEWSDFEVIIESEDLPGVTITGTKTDHTAFVVTYHDQDEYSWKHINNVVNGLDSTSETKALSAYMGNVLAERINNIGTIGRFLAMWDADTGIARYLDVGFEYERGDYFIVATVAGEGGVNYMPDGDTYTGPSAVESDDDLKVSDMYYYDGTYWVYMANHERQIAVDEYLDTTSVNPVQNRVITNKVNDIETAVAIKQDTLISGTNIKTVNNQSLLGAGNIEIKGGGSGGAGYPCIVDVNSKQLSPYSSKQFGDDYNGQYTYMQFTTNLEKEQLVEKMNDLYVTISRRKRQTTRGSGSGKIAKMVVQNDPRFKLNKRLYCWRYTDSGEEEANPRKYYYYYTEERYNDSVADLFEADPYIYMYTGYDFQSSRATCFNVLDRDRSGWVISDAGDLESISRYEAGDIDTFVPKSKIDDEFNYKNYVTKMHCKEATNGGERYFLWCEDWSDTGNSVYGTDIPEYIPEHFDTVEPIDVSEYELGKSRPELDYYVLNENDYSMYDFVEDLYYHTMSSDAYPLQYGHYNWNCYPFDYPIIPTRLADCEVLVSRPNAVYDGVNYQGKWVKLKEIKDMDFFTDLKQIVFRHPLNTAELWMRFSSWQKRCMYQSLGGDTGLDMGYKNCWRYAVDGVVSGDTNYAFKKRSFARQRNCFRSYSNTHSKITEYIEFNLATGDDIAHGLMSKSTPIRKRLVSTSMSARSWLSD